MFGEESSSDVKKTKGSFCFDILPSKEEILGNFCLIF